MRAEDCQFLLSSDEHVAAGDLESISEEHRWAMFADRRPVSLKLREDGYYEISWMKSEQRSILPGLDRPAGIVAFATPFSIGATIHKTTNSVYGHILINEKNEFVQWLIAANDAARTGQYGVTEDQISRLVHLLLPALSHRGMDIEKVEGYLKAWNEIPELGQRLPAPVQLLTPPRFEFDGEAVESLLAEWTEQRRQREQQT